MPFCSAPAWGASGRAEGDGVAAIAPSAARREGRWCASASLCGSASLREALFGEPWRAQGPAAILPRLSTLEERLRRVEIDGDGLTLEDIVRVAGEPATEVALAAGVEARVLASRAVVDAAIRRGDVVYGVSTGFGRLAETVI